MRTERMSEPERGDVTQLLDDLSGGDQEAMDRLMPLVYDELRRLARAHLADERAGHTLQTTALVHEAYLKLVNLERTEWKNRAYFFAVASRAMRRLLIDYARRRKRQKRGGGWQRVTFDEALLVTDLSAEKLIVLDEALTRLAELDERQSRIVEYRFFGGLTIDEVADVMDISPATVKRDWSMARAWLYRVLKKRDDDT